MRVNLPTYLSVGKIALPSTIIQFWDLGGQRSLRDLWPRYYNECHAVAFVLDATDRERLSEAWDVFDRVFSAPQILGVPLLLLANKQDHPESMSVAEVRETYDAWTAARQETTDEWQPDVDGRSPVRAEHRKERLASLDVVGISAIEG